MNFLKVLFALNKAEREERDRAVREKQKASMREEERKKKEEEKAHQAYKDAR